jgi:DNA-binding MltR family transcriptional regulator
MSLDDDLKLHLKINNIVNGLRSNEEEKKKVLEEAQHEETIFAILRIHLYAEKELDSMIESMFNVPNLLKNFGNKLKFLYDLKIIEKPLYDAVKKLNNVRNELAHNLNYGDSEDIYHNLKSGLSTEILKLHEIDVKMIELLHKEKLDDQIKTRILLANIWIQLKLSSTNILAKKFSFSKRLREEVITEVNEKSKS